MARGIGERALVARVCIVAVVAAVAMLGAPRDAFASRGHEFTRTFGEPCLAEPCEGALKEPDGVAVNEATADVYVVDKGANRVVRYNANGEFQSEFNGSGSLPGEEKEAGSGGEPGEIKTGRFNEPEGIAVDNTCVLQKLSEPKCKEEDPSNGDVYVVDAATAHRVIDKYSSEGKYIGQIAQAGSTPFQGHPVDGVAVDSHGSVSVYRGEGVIVDEFSDALANQFVRAVEVPELAGFPLPGIAIDPEGSFYLRQTHGADFTFGRVAKVEPSGHVVTNEVDPEPSSAAAEEQTNGNALIDNVTTVSVFNSAGALIERLGEERGEKHLVEGTGIGVDASGGSLYVADAKAALVVVFGPQLPTSPRIESESISNVTAEGATFGGEINPRSESTEAPTEYWFEYGACAAVEDCSISGYETRVPAPAGQISADFEVHKVRAPVGGLKPNTTYHFRAVARNGQGEGTPGGEKTFTTESIGGALTLPDHRGWELVSPPNKQGALIKPLAEAGIVQAAAGGGRITYMADAPTEKQPQGNTNEVQVLSTRGASSWTSRDIAIPHTGATGLPVGNGPEYKAFNPELTLSVVQPAGEFNPQLSNEASESTAYLHDLTETCGGVCYRPLVTGAPGVANVPPGTQFGEEEECTPRLREKSIVACGPEFVGATDDLSHVTLRAKAPLIETAGAKQLYEWVAGKLSLVSVLPNETPAPEATAQLGLSVGGADQSARGAISADGSRIVWESGGNLYLRDMTRGKTVQLDQGEGCGTCETGGGAFQFASSDGTRVFFTDIHKLTKESGANSTAGAKQGDLYECRIAVEPGGGLACALADLTPLRGSEHAAVQGGVLGASEDGSRLYFVAEGVVTEATNGRGEGPVAGQPNMYVYEGGATRFIATLAPGDHHDWSEELVAQPTRSSPNGTWLAFMSERPLTGYDNRDATTGRPVAEVYLYDASSNHLTCVSCDPTGARPTGVLYHDLEQGSGGLAGGYDLWPSTSLVAANVPGWTAIGSGHRIKERYQPRYLSNSGRLFFNTADALVPQDSNGTQDVYEYEPPGTRGPEGNVVCSTLSETFSFRSGGCVSLISSGLSAQESAFLDASESGDDVFFLTSAQLSLLDTDVAPDIYDAHICTLSQPCIVAAGEKSSTCTSESSCKPGPTPQPSVYAPPTTATFSGPENASPMPRKSATPKPETKVQKLAKALKACHAKKNKKKRQACERQARKKYATPAKKVAKNKSKPKGNRK